MKSFLYLICFSVLLSCSDNSLDNPNCRFLLDIGVNVDFNLSFPKYSPLQFPSNPIYEENIGNGGIIVMNTGTGFVAFDAADPNHAPSECSILSISGINGVCGCEDKNEYNLFTGLPIDNPSLQCPLKAYRVEKSGNILVIFN